MRKTKYFAGLFGAFLLLAATLPTVQAQSSAWWGNVTIINASGSINTSTDGAIVVALVNNVPRTHDPVGTPDSTYYLIHPVCSAGDIVKFQVYGVNASPTNLTGQSCIQGSQPQLNLVAHLVASGSTCPASYATQPGTGNVHNGCSEGFCVHNTCRAAATFCGDGFCDSGESCTADNSACTSSQACTNGCVATTSSGGGSSGGGGGGGGGGSSSGGSTTDPEDPEPTPEPEPPTTGGQLTVVNIPVTSSSEKTSLLRSIKPESLGLESVQEVDVEITQTGVASKKSPNMQETISLIDSALVDATSETAKTALNSMKSRLSTGGESNEVDVELRVYEVKSTVTGLVEKVSRIILKFKASSDKSKVNIIEIIPKSVAQSSSELQFSETAPTVLQEDPILEWTFTNVKSGEEREVSYTVGKGLESIESTTLSDSQASESQEPVPEVQIPFDTTVMLIVVAVIVVIAIAVIAVTRRKKSRYSYRP